MVFSGLSERSGPCLAVYAGPTGGHIFPAQSFSECFKESFPGSHIHLITCRRAKYLVERASPGIYDSVTYLPEFGIAPGLSWRAVKPFLILPYLFIRAFRHLKKIRPDLCVGFGSFVSYPGMMSGHWLKVPTLIHEQNKVPGKATHWLVPHVDVVAESFEGTAFKTKPKVLETVGLPLRRFIRDVARGYGRSGPGEKFTVLVVGGSQGAQGLNAAVLEAMGALSLEERKKIAVIHIAGKQDHARVAAQYQELGIAGEVHPFYGAMDELFRRSDLAITRAGANTLFELAAFGLPALVVPYPHAGGHQKFNAESFALKKGLLFHEEDAAAPKWLAEHLRRYLREPGSLAGFSKAIRELAKPDAAEQLVGIAYKLIKDHENH